MKTFNRLFALLLLSSALAHAQILTSSIPSPVPIFAQTGGIYAFSSSNCRTKLERSNSGTAMNDTLPAASTLPLYCEIQVFNTDTTATDTITPASGTIGTGSALALGPTATAILTSDGSNWQVASGSSTIPTAASVTTLSATGAISTSTTVTATGAISGASLAATGTITGGGALLITGGSLPTLANGYAVIYGDPVNGAVMESQGSTNDAQFATAAGNIWTLAHGLRYISYQALNVVGTIAMNNGFNRCATNTLCAYSNSTIAGEWDSGQHFRAGLQAAAGSTEPTIAANACGSTTQGTITSGSNDAVGIVTVGTASVTSCAVTFKKAWDAAPRGCTISPANATAAGTTGAYVALPTTTGFTIIGTALAGAAYTYHCF